MNRARARREPVPAERAETLRQRIRALLAGPPLTMKEISGEVRISERDVVGHLEHLERSLHHQGCALAVEPAECGRCGFVFAKRDRLKKPGRCPVCRGETIHEPLFSVRERAGSQGICKHPTACDGKWRESDTRRLGDYSPPVTNPGRNDDVDGNLAYPRGEA